MSQGMLAAPSAVPEMVLERRAIAASHALLVAAGLVVLGSYAVLAIAHANDRFQVNFVSSVYTQLAAELNHGRFYPEVYDGSHYGGTRYVPVHFVLHAGLARLTGEYLLSGKLLTYTATMILFVQVFFVLRSLGCRRSIAFALLGLVVTSNPGYLACTTIRGDLLPVVFQMAALMLAADGFTPRRAILAGLCCTLAILTKFSAVWGPAAIAVWYLLRDRRCFWTFSACCLGSLVAALVLLHVGTSGRMLDNFRAISSGEVGIKGVLLAPLLFLWRIGRAGVLLAVLLPMLLAEAVLAYRQSRVTIYHYAFAACLPVLLVIYSDMGADMNHLIDFVVLAILMCGGFLASVYKQDRDGALGRVAAAVGLSWLLYVSWVNSMTLPLLAVLRHADHGYSAKPLKDSVADGETILSEDPWVCLSRGQRPCLLDPFALARFGQTRPQAVKDMIARIDREEFDCVVLLKKLGEGNPNDRFAWDVLHFGPPVVAALCEHYKLETNSEGYYVYRPRSLRH